jgi:two-component system sensor histidine kinase DesK
LTRPAGRLAERHDPNRASYDYADGVAISVRWLWAARAALAGAGLLVALASAPDIVARQQSPAARVAAVVLLCLFAAMWAWFWLSAVTDGRRAAAAVGALTVLAAAVTVLAPPGRDGLVFAALAAGAGLPRRLAAPAVAAVGLAAGLLQLLHGGAAPPAALFTVVNDIVAGCAAMGGRLLVETNEQLLSARAEIARLAAAEERLRVARDLHDLIGQNLTVAVLKTELVSGALPPDVRAAHRDDLDDIAAAVRRSLDDVRSLAAGARRPGIADELAAAGAALRSAGIALSVEDGLGPVPGAVEAALAWAIREGATNILRHSRASHGRVRLYRRDGGAVLEVEDDGRGRIPGPAGSGLAGMAERASALGGTCEEGTPAGGRGFRLVLSLPLGPA